MPSNYSNADIGSDANRLAGQVGGYVAGLFLGPAGERVVVRTSEGVSQILDNSSGRKLRQEAEARRARKAAAKEQEEALREELKLADLRAQAEERMVQRRVKLQRELSRAQRADRLDMPRRKDSAG